MTPGLPAYRLAILALLLVSAPVLRAEPLPIAEVNRILTDPKSTEPRPVTFRGVVNLVVSSNRNIAVQDEQAGISVTVPETIPLPALGAAVEVDTIADFRSTDPDTITPASALRVVGQPGLPEPIRCPISDLRAGKYNRRAVEVDGVVLHARFVDGAYIMHVADSAEWCLVTVYAPSSGWGPSDWFGAQLRIRGVNIGRGEKALRLTSEAGITVLKPGSADPFKAEPASAAKLRADRVSTGERKVLKGIVHGWAPGVVYFRDGDTAFRADFLYPYDTVDRARPYLMPPPVPWVKMGDRVELAGSPLCTGPDLRLRYSTMRVLGPDDHPEPSAAPASAISDGSKANDYVRVAARLISREQVRASAGFVETLRLDSGHGVAQAVLESPRGDLLAQLRANDRVELTGIVVATGGNPAYSLRLANAADVRSLGADPAAIRARFMRVGATASAVILAAALWIVLLRRQVAQRTAALAAEVEERKRAQAEVARALEVERELGDLKVRFVSLVSHEFRTPLGITMSAVELLRNYLDRIPPEEMKQLFDDIYQATLRMSGLMEQVLLLGRVEAGRVQFRAAPLELATLAGKLVDESHSATDRKCTIALRTEGELDGAIGDEALLRHILTNLLSNAVKYSPAGSPVEFITRRDGSDAVFTVSDHGRGIPDEDRARLFEAFHRAGNTADVPGTGLGLLIVKRCVDLHGGSIAFESRVDEGTTFTVRLPLFPKS